MSGVKQEEMTKKNIVSVPASKKGEPDKTYQKVRNKWIDMSTNKEVSPNLIDMLETYLQIDNPEYREKKELPKIDSISGVESNTNVEKLNESILKLTRILESFTKSIDKKFVKQDKVPPLKIQEKDEKVDLLAKRGYEKVVSKTGNINYRDSQSGKFVSKEKATQIPSSFEAAKRILSPVVKETIFGKKNEAGEVVKPSIGRDFLERTFPVAGPLIFGARDARRSAIAESQVQSPKKTEMVNQSPAPKIDIQTLDKENPEPTPKENRNSSFEVNIVDISENVIKKLSDIFNLSNSKEKQNQENGVPEQPSNKPGLFDFLNPKGGKQKGPKPVEPGGPPKPPMLDKNGKPLRGAALKSAEKKAGVKATEKAVEKAGVKAAEKAGVKAAEKAGAKALGKSLLKKIPLVGAGAGLLFGAQRLMEGDVLGAGGEVVSGLASTVPGLGTAASVGIDAALAGRDIYKASNVQSEEQPAMIKPQTINNQTQNMTTLNKQNQVIKESKSAPAAHISQPVNNISAPSTVVNNNTMTNLPTVGPRGSLDLSKFT